MLPKGSSRDLLGEPTRDLVQKRSEIDWVPKSGSSRRPLGLGVVEGRPGERVDSHHPWKAGSFYWVCAWLRWQKGAIHNLWYKMSEPVFSRASNLVAIDRHGNWYYHENKSRPHWWNGMPAPSASPQIKHGIYNANIHILVSLRKGTQCIVLHMLPSAGWFESVIVKQRKSSLHIGTWAKSRAFSMIYPVVMTKSALIPESSSL